MNFVLVLKIAKRSKNKHARITKRLTIAFFKELDEFFPSSVPDCIVTNFQNHDQTFRELFIRNFAVEQMDFKLSISPILADCLLSRKARRPGLSH